MLDRRLIKKKRLEMGMSQQDLADAMGYESKTQISRIENGALDIPTNKAVKLSKILMVEIQELIKGGYKNV
jgi:transcriptional regulator with XRE-family HTH domain